MVEPVGQYECRTSGGVAGRLRVVGCGNAYAADDSVGLEIVRRLRERGEVGCELIAAPCAGPGLIETVEGAEAVLFVDGVSSGAPAGTLHLVPLPSPDVEPRMLSALSTHGWGVAEALGLLSSLRRGTPRVVLLGVEIGTVSPGALRSNAVEEAIRSVVERFADLREFLYGVGKDDWRHPRSFSPGDASFPGG